MRVLEQSTIVAVQLVTLAAWLAKVGNAVGTDSSSPSKPEVQTPQTVYQWYRQNYAHSLPGSMLGASPDASLRLPPSIPSLASIPSQHQRASTPGELNQQKRPETAIGDQSALRAGDTFDGARVAKGELGTLLDDQTEPASSADQLLIGLPETAAPQSVRSNDISQEYHNDADNETHNRYKSEDEYGVGYFEPIQRHGSTEPLQPTHTNHFYDSLVDIASRQGKDHGESSSSKRGFQFNLLEDFVNIPPFNPSNSASGLSKSAEEKPFAVSPRQLKLKTNMLAHTLRYSSDLEEVCSQYLKLLSELAGDEFDFQQADISIAKDLFKAAIKELESFELFNVYAAEPRNIAIMKDCLDSLMEGQLELIHDSDATSSSHHSNYTDQDNNDDKQSPGSTSNKELIDILLKENNTLKSKLRKVEQELARVLRHINLSPLQSDSD